MGFARKDVEATKKMEKKFVRYPEGAEKYSLGLTKFQALAKEAEETGKPRNFNKKESDFLLKKEKTSCNPTK